MDIEIAGALTAALAPALPYLLKSTEEAAKEAGKKLGAAVWAQATELWGLLKPKVEGSSTAAKAAERIVREPEREEARGAFKLELEDILHTDPQLLARLAELLKAASGTQTYQACNTGEGAIAQGAGAVAAGKGGVAVGGNVSGNVLVGRGEDS